MKFPQLPEKQYRILEVKESGETKFFPQEQHYYFFWKSIIRDGYTYLKEEFHTMGQAEKFLFQFQQDEFVRVIDAKLKKQAKKLDTKTPHPFNAVFYKLKKTKENE